MHLLSAPIVVTLPTSKLLLQELVVRVNVLHDCANEWQFFANAKGWNDVTYNFPDGLPLAIVNPKPLTLNPKP